MNAHAPTSHPVETLTVLTASIAHEVKQPLSGIAINAGTCLRLLCGECPDIEGARETARRLIRDAHRAAEVVNRLRALFTSTVTTSDRIDLNDVLEDALASMQPELDTYHVSVACMLDDGLPPVIGDRVQLQQVIINLLRNGAEAMCEVQDRERKLLISTRPHDANNVQLSVSDVGIGFPSDNAQRLFTPFYTTKVRGMGIGLALSRSIVEAHSGQLWGAPNDQGPGATFSLSIPHASAPRAATVKSRNVGDAAGLTLALAA